MTTTRARLVVLMVAVVALVAVSAVMATARGQGNPHGIGVVYVTSQGLYYDTMVVKDPLPPHGRFQLLENGETEFGPGDPGYLGGRWKAPDGQGGWHYFLCPLLGPGREAP